MPATPHAYLLQSLSSIDKADRLFVCSGTLNSGGLSIGLQKDERWISLVRVVAARRFLVVLRAPPGSPITAVVAADLAGSLALGVKGRIEHLGWTGLGVESVRRVNRDRGPIRRKGATK